MSIHPKFFIDFNHAPVGMPPIGERELQVNEFVAVEHKGHTRGFLHVLASDEEGFYGEYAYEIRDAGEFDHLKGKMGAKAREELMASHLEDFAANGLTEKKLRPIEDTGAEAFREKIADILRLPTMPRDFAREAAPAHTPSPLMGLTVKPALPGSDF